MRTRSSATLLGAFILATTASSASTEDNLLPNQPAISFFWSTFNDALFDLPRCAGFQVITVPNNASARPVVEPLYFTAFPIGYEPVTMQLPAIGVRQQFTWNANYPVGTQLTFAMTDSANNSGGAVDKYVITQSSLQNCTLVQDEVSPITFTSNPSDRPCGDIDLDIKGGKAPYTVSVLAGQSGLYGNVTGVKSREVRIANVVSAGQTFNLLVTDSTGISSQVSSDMTSGLSLGTCNLPTEDGGGSSTPIGAIVGGVVGGIVAAGIIGLIAWWFIRKRSKQRQEEYRQQQQQSEFRNADGRAPLVEPFMLQTQGSNVRNTGVSDQYNDVSPTAYGSYDKSLDHYPSSPSHAYPSDHQQHYFGHPEHQPQPPSSSSSPYDSHPQYNNSYPVQNSNYSNPYDSYETPEPISSTSGTYQSYETTHRDPSSNPYPSEPRRGPTSNSSATDDLANPEEFEFRIPDQQGWNGASSSSHLPAGARPYR
ncbi:hypothetical protein JCM5353_006635 [Sporobolomyces roseus]